MRTTSDTYKAIRNTAGYHYNVKVVCNDTEVTYGMDKLKSVHIKPLLFAENGPSIGNACSTECDLVFMETSSNWPRMAEFEVLVQIANEANTQLSEWLSMGTYITDERVKTVNGDLQIIGFDKMLEMEQSWTDKITPPANWPITAKAWCDLVEAANLVEFDSRNVIDNTVAFIGLNSTSTIRDVLKDIAAAHGGNFVMTSDGKIRLVPLPHIKPSTKQWLTTVHFSSFHQLMGQLGELLKPVLSLSIGVVLHPRLLRDLVVWGFQEGKSRSF